MYTRYWSPGSAAMALHAVLIELGVPYKPGHINIDRGEARRPDYRKPSLHARVPTLAHSEVVMYESAAILQHLRERHPEAG
jgi:glutathione S-transferase